MGENRKFYAEARKLISASLGNHIYGAMDVKALANLLHAVHKAAQQVELVRAQAQSSFYLRHGEVSSGLLEDASMVGRAATDFVKMEAALEAKLKDATGYHKLVEIIREDSVLIAQINQQIQRLNHLCNTTLEGA